MSDGSVLLKDLQKLVVAIQADLRQRAQELPDVRATLEAEYERARKQERTAQALSAWTEDFLAQVAAAWVLGCVFVRYLEDNDLIAERWLGGTDNRGRDEARHRHQHYFRQHPRDSDREYLQHVFRTVGAIPAASELFAEGRTPLWVVGPSGDMVRDILAFWQDPARGALDRTFVAAPGDTRFLGDLYQDLSEDVRKKYALLQTPIFVEEFILDRTLTPALAEFGLETVRLIDPTCGSGHFLLGAFERLLKQWRMRWQHTADIRDTNVGALAQKAMDQIYGVDINPYAVAIARFRLIVAALHACDHVRLKDAPGWKLHVHSGDSLYYGRRWTPTTNVPSDQPWLDASWANYHGLEDPTAVNETLSRKYHVVVGNPPYITVKDPALSKTYRARFRTCHMQYSLGVPFTERFFDLCLASEEGKHGAGYVGMITTNSFMKREFGSKLIEQFLPRIDLTHIIDTSGAYIPGHGTPTVILFGCNRNPVGNKLRAVLGIKGDSTPPLDPAAGQVWLSIVESVDRPGTKTEYTSVTDVPRSTYAKHPWSIGGGGAAELKQQIEREYTATLHSSGANVGYLIITGEDNCLLLEEAAAKRRGVSHLIPVGDGESVREWSLSSKQICVWPNTLSGQRLEEEVLGSLLDYLWPYRTSLKDRKAFGIPVEHKGIPWWAIREVYKDRFCTRIWIAYAEVSTHNHFALERGQRIFTQTAPVIKLWAHSDESDYLGILGLLNCSTACFWLKQVCHNKGAGGGTRVDSGHSPLGDENYESHFAFNATNVQNFPLPADRPLGFARQLDCLARQHSDSLPDAVFRHGVPNYKDLDPAYAECLRQQMIALQEELDWKCYHLFGLTDAPLTFEGEVPPINLGERAFEIVLARKVASGEVQTAWFERHRSTPITDIPNHWRADYRALVEQRIAIIEANPNIALIEQPEYKRRWNTEPWEDQEQRALRGWLLDRLETDRYWTRPAQGGEPLLQSCAQLAAIAQADADFMQVGALYTDNAVFDVATLVEELVASESVPYLPVLRYKPSGLLKRAEWEKTWGLQRKEDAGEKLTNPIPVPTKYTSADFLQSNHWRLRGKLDVPKERWVSYPHAERDGDASLVVTWAGYDHLEQARALAAYYDGMKGKGWSPDRLAPLLAGIDQLVPWLLQWHNDFDPEMQVRWGEFFREFVRDESQNLGKTLEGIRGWQPPERKRAPRRNSRDATKQPDDVE